jgi:hypothetical protein
MQLDVDSLVLHIIRNGRAFKKKHSLNLYVSKMLSSSDNTINLYSTEYVQKAEFASTIPDFYLQ